MRTIRTKVYQFSELDEQAKEKAIEWFRDGNEYHFSDEVIETIKEGLKHFGAEISKYEIDWNNINLCSYKIDLNTTDEIEELSGVRLFKYIQNNYLTYYDKYTKKNQNLLDGDCPFTGVCFDEDFLDNIRKFVKKPDNTTFKELLEESVYNAINSGCKDWDYNNSDEGIAKTIEANEYEFKKDGTRF